MATSVMPGMLGQMDQAQEKPKDPTADVPSQATGDKDTQPDENGLTKKDRENLMLVRRMYKERWASERRVIVRGILKRMTYLSGNQYYSVSGDGITFEDPLSSDDGTQQGTDAQEIYQYVTNIIQWFERVLVSTLSASVPATRFQPSNAQSDLGNRVAQQASRANAYIERLNDAKKLTEQKVSYLALAGSYFVYTRALRDSRLSGDQKETLTTEEMQETEVKPDRYLCNQCGAETPVQNMMAESQFKCESCQYPLSEADFYPAMTLPMPVVTNSEELPPVQPRQSLYHGLHVDAMPSADSDTGDPLVRTPILDLSLETDIGALRAMYPKLWRDLENGTESSGSGETELDRTARLQSTSQGTEANGWNKSTGLNTRGQMPTYSRTWLQPESFNVLSIEAEAQRLHQLFPDGCCVASWNGNYIDVRKAKLADEWTWGGTRSGFGLYPPAILQPAMDFQDRINDAGNTESEYYDRMAVPGIAYDSTAINGKGLAGKFWKVGAWFPVRVKRAEGRSLQDVLFQPKFSMDKGIENFQQRLILMAQLVVGVTPQTYGGTQQGIETKGGQEQALQVATGILWLYWSAIRSECARTAKNGIKCLAQSATEEVFDVIKGDDGQFKNEPIDLDALKNEINSYPEEEQGFPESREQMGERLEKMILGAADNPLVMEMLGPMKNRRMVARTLLPQDMVVPDEDNRLKVQEDIAALLQGVATPSMDPMTGTPVLIPSVLPDKDVDDLEVTQITVKEYVTKNYRELRDQKPQQFENIIAYLRLAVQFEKQQMIENAPPAPPGGPPGAGAGAGAGAAASP